MTGSSPATRTGCSRGDWTGATEFQYIPAYIEETINPVNFESDKICGGAFSLGPLRDQGTASDPIVDEDEMDSYLKIFVYVSTDFVLNISPCLNAVPSTGVFAMDRHMFAEQGIYIKFQKVSSPPPPG